MTFAEELKVKKKKIVELVREQLKLKKTKDYTLVVPEEGVMLISDGLSKHQEKWFVQVLPEPEYIAETRQMEYVQIMGEVEEKLHKKHKLTIYLGSMLPIL